MLYGRVPGGDLSMLNLATENTEITEITEITEKTQKRFRVFRVFRGYLHDISNKQVPFALVRRRGAVGDANLFRRAGY
jgi:hypothetical protein